MLVDKQLPFGQYEFVDVTFPPSADTDHIIKYSIIDPEHPEDVRWIEINTESATASSTSGMRSWGFIIGDGTNVITTGQKGYSPPIPFSGTITKATILSTDAAATAGSIVIDIWKDTYANYPPTNPDSITASAPPTLSAANKNQDSTLSGWTTTITAGDVLGWNVDSVSGITRVVVNLEIAVSQAASQARVYRSSGSGQLPWGHGYIALRSSEANYATRLLLFLERS